MPDNNKRPLISERAVVSCLVIASVLCTLAFCVSGCTPIVWEKPGATQQDFTRDKYACDRDVRQSSVGDEFDAFDFYTECMNAHGWQIAQ